MKNWAFAAASLVLTTAAHAESATNLSASTAQMVQAPAEKGARCAQGIQPIPVMTTDAGGNAMFCANDGTWEHVSQASRARADQNSKPEI